MAVLQRKITVAHFTVLVTALLILLYYFGSGSAVNKKQIQAKPWQELVQDQNGPEQVQLSAAVTNKRCTGLDCVLENEQAGLSAQITMETCTGVDCVLENEKTCLSTTNMANKVNESIALSNARYLYEEYRKVIPVDSLPDYSSHCWNMHFDVSIHDQGHMGDYSFTKFRENHKRYYKGKFSSDLVCLPNVFLAGFPKCGSTYAYCFMQSLIHQSNGLSMKAKTEAYKEPNFWVKGRNWPKPTDLAQYLLNFAPGLEMMKSHNNTKVTLMDGSETGLFNSPHFDAKQPNNSNYCILPSTIPELLPKSKFIIITRNPLKMLYSAFWFSCTTYGIRVPRQTQLIGPELFHKRIKTKMDLFNDCMRDPSSEEASEPCSLFDDSDYGTCITKRLHLLDMCVHKITFELFSPELPKCGRSRVAMGIYFTHIRKLLSVVPRERVLVYTLEQLAKEHEVVAGNVFEFLELPLTDDVLSKVKLAASTCSENSQIAIPYKTDPVLKMKDKTKAMILKFYKPFNVLLADLLGDNRFLWE